MSITIRDKVLIFNCTKYSVEDHIDLISIIVNYSGLVTDDDDDQAGELYVAIVTGINGLERVQKVLQKIAILMMISLMVKALRRL